MSDFLVQFEPEFNKAHDFLQKELVMIQAGRANPAMVEEVSISAYENTMKLQELATISVPDPKSIVVSPWDKSVTKNIINGLKEAKLDMQIIADGDSIRLVVPQLTEESRVKLTKHLSEKLEKARVAVRQTRDRAKEKILDAKKEKEISEDEKFTFLKELDEITKKHITKIDEDGAKKKEELMTI